MSEGTATEQTNGSKTEGATKGYDIIGDIHGCAQELVALLKKLGYVKSLASAPYQHPEGRIAVFVGDLIDRGPAVREVLEIVKGMHDAGFALCVMGNHEFNATRFWGRASEGLGYYREHSHKNICQHYATIKAFQNREQEWFDTYLPWFSTLPIFLDLDGFRVVHALWTNKLIQKRKWYTLSPSLGHVLKGEKIELPEGLSYPDKDGNKRTSGRVKWWLDWDKSGSGDKLTYGEYLEDGAMSDEIRDRLAEIPIPDTEPRYGYGADQKPVFFGHYWLRGEPVLQAPNVCCLDYSCAKGDKLLCYRWDGEQVLDRSKFLWVDSGET